MSEYCECENPVAEMSSALGEKFKVCSLLKGGCGKEVILFTVEDVPFPASGEFNPKQDISG